MTMIFLLKKNLPKNSPKMGQKYQVTIVKILLNYDNDISNIKKNCQKCPKNVPKVARKYCQNIELLLLNYQNKSSNIQQKWVDLQRKFTYLVHPLPAIVYFCQFSINGTLLGRSSHKFAEKATFIRLSKCQQAKDRPVHQRADIELIFLYQKEGSAKLSPRLPAPL